MSKAFPTDNPFLRGYFGPVNTEADAPNLPVTGEVPKTLCGTLYRNGPNPQFAPRGPYHWFAGDGMIHAFRIENGRVAYRNRWVRTPKWELEHAEGEGLPGSFEAAPLFPRPDGSPVTDHTPPARLFRWTFELSRDPIAMREEQLDDRVGEFPRFDERFCMAPYRHGWIVSSNVTDPVRGTRTDEALTHYDLATGKATDWRGAPGDRFSEPVFVPRSPDAEEGDGWLLSVIFRAAETRSDLGILEARDIGKGPIALAHLSSRVPAGFHGNWVPSAGPAPAAAA
jgi:carotenoid cleavage dioxygenase